MRLSIKALACALGLWWAGAVLVTGLLNLAWEGYGAAFLELAASVYPGYEATRSLGGVVVATLYALVDGAVCGAIIAFLYNLCARPRSA